MKWLDLGGQYASRQIALSERRIRVRRLVVIGIVGLVVSSLFLMGQSAGKADCSRWAVRVTALGVTSLQDISAEVDLAEHDLESGWEPFAATAREEGKRGKVADPILRPYVFSRRCLSE